MTILTTTTTTVTDRKNPIFVYGTLKRGFPYHHLLEPYTSTNEVVYVGRHKTLNPYPLVLGPLAVPILLNRPKSGYRITGEVYLVADKVMPSLDALEGIGKGHYDRLPVLVTPVNEDGGDGEVTEVEVYFAQEGYAQEMWEKCGKGSFEEYLISHVDKFDWDEENRDVDLTLADLAHIFLDKIPYEVDLKPISASVTDKVLENKVAVNKINEELDSKVDLELISANITDKVITDMVDLESNSTKGNDKVVIDQNVDLDQLASTDVTEKVNDEKVDLEPVSANVTDHKVIDHGHKVDLTPMLTTLTNNVIKV